MQVDAAAVTHTGRVRTVNEDAYLTLPSLALVADGMGGHAAGDVASSLAVTAFEELRSRAAITADDVLGALRRANDAIVAEARAHPDKAGMGTTATGVAVVDEAGSPHWLVFNIGDSRVYRVTGESIHQLTVDHSEVAAMVANGQITAEESRSHPHRHVITRSLGVVPAPDPDTWLVPASAGDLLLVCSDGLTADLEDHQIAEIVRRPGDHSARAQRLVEAALEAGGHDNITVLLVSPASTAEEPNDLTSLTGSTQPLARLLAKAPSDGESP